MDLDVLLITPRSTYVNEIAQKVYPPLNLLYLAASLREHGYQVDVLDANAFRLTDAQITEHIRRTRPRLVGIPVYSEILPQVRSLTRLAKAAGDCKVVLGGPHTAAVPEKAMEYFPDADFILCGEAEYSLPTLVKHLDEPQQYDSIPGLWRREHGGLHVNPCQDERPNIHKIPVPARDLVDRGYQEKRYYAIMVRQKPVDTIMTSRGCPFRCNFCYNTNHKYRGREPDDVMEELISIRKRGIRNVEIVDDHFTADRKRAMKIFDLIIRENLGISFRIKSRVNVVDEELLRKARQAGAYQVSYGAESGVQKILDAMNKKIKVEHIVHACTLTKKLGLAVHTSWVFGYPGETPETMAETVDLVIKIKPTTANVALIRPYPETTAYLEARELGWLRGDWHPDADDYPWIQLPWADSKEALKGMVKKAMRRIYYRPHYIKSFGGEIFRNANWRLGKYALQELRKTLLPSR